jgi:hypothetical protein
MPGFRISSTTGITSISSAALPSWVAVAAAVAAAAVVAPDLGVIQASSRVTNTRRLLSRNPHPDKIRRVRIVISSKSMGAGRRAAAKKTCLHLQVCERVLDVVLLIMHETSPPSYNK